MMCVDLRIVIQSYFSEEIAEPHKVHADQARYIIVLHGTTTFLYCKYK